VKIKLPNERAYDRLAKHDFSLFSQKHCCICGKPVNARTDWLLATRELDGGFESAIHHPDDAPLCDSPNKMPDLYVTPIGPDCLRRHPELRTFVLPRSRAKEEGK
jgi:hypothetical protein